LWEPHGKGRLSKLGMATRLAPAKNIHKGHINAYIYMALFNYLQI